MLPLFSRLTFEMLNFSDELAAIIANQKNIVPSRRHILSGVYVPALHQLRAYGPPLASPSSRLAAQCLLQLGDYLAASKLGYPRGYTWVLLLRLSERLGLAERANGEGRFAPGAEAEAFFVFSLQHERVGVVLVEAISNRKNLVRIATEQMAAAGTIINRFIVVCRREHQNTSESDGSEDADLVVSDDPSTTASRILQLLNVATAPPQEERNNE
jgi:hypothetical protein